METTLTLLQTYSLPVLAFAFLVVSAIFVLRLTVDKAIATSFQTHAKELELELTRQSAFKQQVLLDRYTTITALSTRLQQVLSNLQRVRAGMEAPEGFFLKGYGVKDIVPLTDVFNDLENRRAILTEDFHSLLFEQAKLVEKASNATAAQWEETAKAYGNLSLRLRDKLNERFGLDQIWL